MIARLFGVLTGPDFSSAEALLSSNQPFIDGIELRLDTFHSIDLEEVRVFLQNAPLPVMLTVRRKDQGGQFPGSEEERLDLLRQLCALKPAYIDLEYDVPKAFFRALFETYSDVKIICSYHDFKETPDLELLYQKMRSPYAHITKIAVTSNSTLDALQMLFFIQKHAKKEKIIGISMGGTGQITRILSPLIGNYLTYASLDALDPIAPGQLTARKMQETYRFASLNPQSKVYALIGDPVEKSVGDSVHNAYFSDKNSNAVYVKIPLKSEEISSFFQHIHSLPFSGLSVTMPHKESVIPFLSQVSADVAEIGACNTIKIEKTQLLGFNTDGIGALDAIEKKSLVKDKHLVILGAGGAAKAIAYEAVRRGAKVTIINRSKEKAEAIATLYHCRGGGFELMPQVLAQGYAIIVNCTASETPVEESWILPHTIAMDIVYVPKMTSFLQNAAHKNCALIFGQEMFINQAVAQEQIWFPQDFNEEQCYNIIAQRLK